MPPRCMRESERMWVIAPVVQQQQQSLWMGNSEGYAERRGGGTKHDSQIKIENAETGSLLRAIHKGRPHRDRGEGGSPKADIVREVACI